MGNIEQFKRHTGKPVELKLKNEAGEEDTFEFKLLNMDQFCITQLLSQKIDLTTTPPTANFNKEDMELFKELYRSLIKRSYPDIDQETADTFIVKHYPELTDLLAKLAPSEISPEQAELLKKFIKTEREKIATKESGIDLLKNKFKP